MKRRVMLAAVLAAGTILSASARGDDAISPEARRGREHERSVVGSDVPRLM